MTLSAEAIAERLPTEAPAGTLVEADNFVVKASPLTHIPEGAIELGTPQRPEGMTSYEELPSEVQLEIRRMHLLALDRARLAGL